jgi:NADH:ubiquinone oxidoreductase subunit 3 (subunit A)
MTELPIAELLVAFIFILAASFIIYVLGWFLSPKPVQSENAQSAYACGEKAAFTKLRVNVSLYKYLIYFVVLDSSVLLIAFASLALPSIDVVIFMLYLFIVLVSGFLLLGGGDR